jgi:Tol biopolymer transport system component
VQGPGVSGRCWVHAGSVTALGDVAELPERTLPSGRGKIAYDWRGNIWLINPDGTGQQQLTNLEGNWSFDWSPDGTRLVAAYTDHNRTLSNLRVIDVATGDWTVLTEPAFDEHGQLFLVRHPAWSPDGKTILYVITTKQQQQMGMLVSIGSDGSNPGQPLPIIHGETEDFPAWSPDSQRITYSLKKRAIGGLPENYLFWAIDIDGGNPEKLHVGGTSSSSWSPDGSRIAYNASHVNGMDIFVMNSDGTGKVQLTHDGFSQDPDWSPDGKQIVFMNWAHRQQMEIWIMNADVSDAYRLTKGLWKPAWQPIP